MRFAILTLLIAATTSASIVASPKRETIVGDVIAYDHLNNLINITFAPSQVTLIVRTGATRHKPSRLIQVFYTYWRYHVSLAAQDN